MVMVMGRSSRKLCLAAALALLVRCTDPFAPRIPTPEERPDEDDEDASMVALGAVSPSLAEVGVRI
jgi:hypothetical protein